MTAETLSDSRPGPPGRARPPGREPFWFGVATVARLELRQRVRSSRWVAVLIVWTAILALLTVLIRWAVFRSYTVDGTFGVTADAARMHAQAGRMVFGITVFLVLSLGALVVPALSSTSINGDRTAGILATLQTTLLTPLQIVLGKLVASWAVALALLACAAPFIVWGFLDGGTPVARLIVVLALLALVLLVVCAIGLGWSAIAARTSSSALLTYLSVIFLGLGLPLLFALSIPLATSRENVTVRQSEYPSDGSAPTCVSQSQQMGVFHSERSWWLLAASPYVVLADAAPKPLDGNTTDDPLTAIRSGVREARLGPDPVRDWCADNGDPQAAYSEHERQRAIQRERLGITWPFGLAADLALGTLFAGIAVRRLRAPARRLPRGTRVA